MNLERRGDTIYVSGVINEDSDFSPLLTEPGPLKLDLESVERINSIGVRSWLKFLSQWGDEKRIEYWNCSTVIADQLCIISAMRGIRKKIAHVKSAMIPTECNGCGKEGEIMVTDEMVKANPEIAEDLGPCSRCKAPTASAIPDFAVIFENDA